MTSPPNSTKSPYPLEIDGVELFDDEDLACAIPGARLDRDRPFHFGFDYEGYFAALEAEPKLRPAAAPPQRAHKQRKPTLASVAKQASKAALPVARYEVKPDGTVVIVTGTPEPAAHGEDPWPLGEFRTKEPKQ